MLTLEELEEYAFLNHIPIMLKDGIEYLTRYIKENSVTTILEIGTAIGYSSIKMALVDPKIEIVTIERDLKRYEEALKNVQSFGLENQITILYEDALNTTLDKKFDLIFIDAAKSQYIKFFEKFKNNLNESGTIVSDNLLFHGLVSKKEEIESKNLRQLVKKIDQYVTFLKENQEFDTEFLEIGDGLGISKYKNNKINEKGEK